MGACSFRQQCFATIEKVRLSLLTKHSLSYLLRSYIPGKQICYSVKLRLDEMTNLNTAIGLYHKTYYGRINSVT